MPGTANALQNVLDGYRKFLRKKDLVPPGAVARRAQDAEEGVS